MADLVATAIAYAIGMGGFMVIPWHERAKIAGWLLVAAVAASSAFPILWARVTNDPLGERLLGAVVWGAFIGGAICGIFLWIRAVAKESPKDSGDGEDG